MMTDLTPNWEPIGETDPFTRLLSTIWVNGCAMHLEARQIKTGTEFQEVVEFPEDYENLCRLYGPDGAWFQTFELDGRTYVPFAVPFGE